MRPVRFLFIAAAMLPAASAALAQTGAVPAFVQGPRERLPSGAAKVSVQSNGFELVLDRPFSGAEVREVDRNTERGTVEALPSRRIEGLDVEGRRETQTAPFSIVRDFWSSARLWLNVLQVETTAEFTVIGRFANVSLEEPDASLFTLPSGYTIVDSPYAFDIPFGPVEPAKPLIR